MEQFNHIQTKEILQDIKDTEQEIKDYGDELEVLMRNPVQNKVRIYMIQGNLSIRKEFVKMLNEILEFRNEEIK
jgi:hypothetical protein